MLYRINDDVDGRGVSAIAVRVNLFFRQSFF